MAEWAGPGPGAYEVPSAVAARTAISSIPNVPGIVFGKSVARPSIKAIATGGPGPGANFRFERPGMSADSRKPNIPAYSLVGRIERGGPLDNGTDARNRPGPGSYSNLEDPKHRRAPAVTMAFRQPDPRERLAKLGPAPGQYRVQESFGRQVLSTKPTQSAVVFGTGNRHTLHRGGATDVGPADYNVQYSMGKQLLSTKRSAAAAVMGVRREAKPAANAERAGPGSYRLSQATGKQVLSTVRTARAARMSGRTKFGSYI